MSATQSVMGVQGPRFVHREKILRLKDELFRRWICSDDDLRDIIICSILVRDAKVLLVGPPESGKSQLVRSIANAIYSKSGDVVFAFETGAPEKTLQKVLCTTDIVRLLTKGEERFIVRPIVKARIKFFNELNRFSKAVQDALLSLLEEKKLVEYGGVVFRSPDYVCFADINPYRGEVEPALRSRFMVSIPTGYLSIADEYKLLDFVLSHGTYDISQTMPKIIAIEELEEVWSDVERVRVPETVRLFLTMLVAAFRVCKHGRKLTIPGWKSHLCTNCEYAGEICSKVLVPPGERAVIYTILFARARAWLHSRSCVSYEDIVRVLPYVLAHRIELHPLARSEASDPWTWCKSAVSTLIETRWGTPKSPGAWMKALALATIALSISADAVTREVIQRQGYDRLSPLEAVWELHSLANSGRGDLVLKELLSFVSRRFEEVSQSKVPAVKKYVETVSKSAQTLEEMMSCLKLIKRTLLPQHASDIIRRIRLSMEEFSVHVPLTLALRGVKVGQIVLDRKLVNNLSRRGSLRQGDAIIEMRGEELVVFLPTREEAERARRELMRYVRD